MKITSFVFHQVNTNRRQQSLQKEFDSTLDVAPPLALSWTPKIKSVCPKPRKESVNGRDTRTGVLYSKRLGNKRVDVLFLQYKWKISTTLLSAFLVLMSRIGFTAVTDLVSSREKRVGSQERQGDFIYRKQSSLLGNIKVSKAFRVIMIKEPGEEYSVPKVREMVDPHPGSY